MAHGADLVRGYSGCRGAGVIEDLLQRRYEAHLDSVRPGQPTECDTRNLAVRREVFETITFNQCYRRVGDTEFGLRAEAAGFRVAYWPGMIVDHLHEPDLPLFVAKQVCHGWGAQRLMQTEPELPWHSAHLRHTARVSSFVARVPARGAAGSALSIAAVGCARGLQRAAPQLPRWAAQAALTGLDKAGGLAGHLRYMPGTDEPAPSQILGRRLLRD
jgi:hypothetical protein